ncbi:MAG: serine hydrolase domain-containing protein [Acidobacteriaceae bacterium]
MPQQFSAKPASADSVHALAFDYGQQDTIFANAYALLREAISSHAFPSASLAVTHRGRLIALKGLGTFTYDLHSPQVKSDTIFDLASVTKVIASTTMAMILYQRGLLDLDTPVVSILPQFRGDDLRRLAITIRMLLAHSSGLPAHEKFYLHSRSRETVISAALKVPLATPPDTKMEYSDIGFIILGKILEMTANESLDAFCQREVFGPMAMTSTGFNPPSLLRPLIPPTADDKTFRRRIIQGEVQDENASAMGGVAGHAGVFSSANDVAIFAHLMLSGGRPLLRPETVNTFTRRQPVPDGTSRALGWDTPSSPSQSGDFFSVRSFGHTGYTGTSLWIDPERDLSITLLTNRTWPDCSNQMIKQVRPKFHNAVVEALGLAPGRS